MNLLIRFFCGNFNTRDNTGDNCFPGGGTHNTRNICFPGGGTHNTRDMCFQGGETHNTRDMCFQGGVTHNTRDMCFQGGGTHNTKDMCFQGGYLKANLKNISTDSSKFCSVHSLKTCTKLATKWRNFL